MKNLFNKNNIQLFVLLLVMSIFGIFYWQTVMSLPLFGDATIHGEQAKILYQGGWKALAADYPSHYYYIMAILYSFFGEKGYNFVPFIGLLFLLLSSFLLVKQLTKNYLLSLLAIFVVGSSPKVIYYTARMYQEILLSGMFIFGIYLVFKYLEVRSKSMLLLLAIFTGVILSLKQQGLFIFYSSVILFFITDFIRKKTSFAVLSLIVFAPIFLGIAYYGVLFHTKGEIQPGSDEFKLFKIINSVGKKVFFYTPQNNSLLNQNNESFNLFIPLTYAATKISKDNLESKLNKIDNQYSTRAYSRAESRHIWPTDVFTSFDKFNEANNLYLLTWQGLKLESPVLFYLLFFCLIMGFFYCVWHYRKYSSLLIFSAIFLSINYVLFARNNDQQRYHLFLPIFLLSFTFILLSQTMHRLHINESLKSLSIIFFVVVIFTPILSDRISLNKFWSETQLYSPSVGGIASVQEMGSWVDKHTNQSITLGQQCGNETQYYSNRKVLGDWRIYFLNNDSLKTYLNKEDISYYILYKSQLVPDSDWYHICWVPESFYDRLESDFSHAYVTKSKDIIVYKVK